ncbi:MAG: fibro-slime domain-containing protein [Fibrobacter sp.]|nr:fibro-slime domain-containing protein [Fibrobacter sp.]
MKNLTSSINNQRGIISMIVLVMMLIVAIIILNTVINSHMNQTSSDNYKYKIQTFHIGDGLMTLLAQDMIDTNDGNYLTDNMISADIGSPSKSGSHSYDALKNIDTMKGAGVDIIGYSDQFHYYYKRVKGDLDVSVKVISLSNTHEWAKAGIMIREKLTHNSKHVFTFRAHNSWRGIRLQCRKTDGGNTDQFPAGESAPDAEWVRIKRNGNTITAFRSSNGSSWIQIYSNSVPMTDSVYVGLAVTSHNKYYINTALFSNLNGLARRTCTDSTIVGTDSIHVKYTIDEIGSGIYNMSTVSYKPKGTLKELDFVTSLNQVIAREQEGVWKSDYNDSAFIPVTFYDMRADMTNPEFNISVDVWNPCPPCTLGPATTGYKYAHFIQTTGLTADRKPIKKTPNATFRAMFMSAWDGSWYTQTPAYRTWKMNSDPPYTAMGAAIGTDPSFSWCFNDSMHTWFKPYGDSAGKTGVYSYDYVNHRWSGLKVRPGWTAASGHDTEWVTQHWNPNHPFANIVMYDTLKFIEKPSNPGVFSFGSDLTDERWFLSCSDWSSSSKPYKFMPLQNRGFGYDCDARYWTFTTKTACFKKQNFGFTMEMHRNFTYKKGQIFEFKGDDDVFVFINNKAVVNMGGIYGDGIAKVNLDTLGLTEGKEYPFDFFYCERAITGSNILVTTNMLFYTPPQKAKRNWKRDYGNLD